MLDNVAAARVLLCDDHEIYRTGLRHLIEAEHDIVVVGEAHSSSTLLSDARQSGANIIVIRQNLLRGARESDLRDLCISGRQVLILAETESEIELTHAVRLGVRGYMSNWVSADRLLKGIRALARDEPALEPAYERHLLRFLAEGSEVPSEAVLTGGAAQELLTERQLVVARLVAKGLSNSEIASQLFVSQATVKSHVTAVLRRFGVRSRVQLAIRLNEHERTRATEVA